MTEVCEHIDIYATARQVDPTRTTALRRAFERDMRRRFRELKSAIRRAIIDEDCFGLTVQTLQLTVPGRRAFAFATSQEKVAGFMDWLRRQEAQGVLQTVHIQQLGVAAEQPWTNTYIYDSYSRGVERARYEMGKAGYDVPSMEQTGGIGYSMNTPFHVDRVGLLYTRAFEQLRGITSQMDTQITQTLARGLVDGDHPRVLARKLVNDVDGNLGLKIRYTDPRTGKPISYMMPPERRATILARTETIRAHAEAQLQEFENWKVAGVSAKAEFRTAMDNRVCDLCADMEGEVRTIEEARGVIPVHPQCRCMWLPASLEEPVTPEPPPAETWQKDPVARNMLNPDDGRQYFEYKKEYASQLKLINAQTSGSIVKKAQEFTENGLTKNSRLPQKLQDMIKADSHLKIMNEITANWQGSAQAEQSMSLKIWASKLEKVPKVIYHEYSRYSPEHLAKFAKEYMSKTDYLKIRAFNQAYADLVKVPNKLTLFRGTDGGEGQKIRKAILKPGLKRTRWKMVDSSLSGYSDKMSAGKDFGLNTRGITVRHVFKKSEILIHRDFLSPLNYGAYSFEHEWIMIGLDKYVSLKDMAFYVRVGVEAEHAGVLIKQFGELIP